MTSILLLVAALLTQAEESRASRARQAAYARAPLARSMARDPELVADVQARNARDEPAAKILERDKAWKAGREQPLRKELTSSPCAERLRNLTRDDSFIVEVILMDARGALVCATVETTDYWQGDELKWKKPVEEGLEIFVDAPELDRNTGHQAIQLAVPVKAGDQRVGALSLTVKVLVQPAAERPAP